MPRTWCRRPGCAGRLDTLRSRRRRRESYVGPWLPEPIATGPEEHAADPAEPVLLAESVSPAFLVVLESLSPLQRVVFGRHDPFGFDPAEVARAVGRSEPAVRQLASRWRVTGLNGRAGVLVHLGHRLIATVDRDTVGGRVETIRVQLNPAKLAWAGSTDSRGDPVPARRRATDDRSAPPTRAIAGPSLVLIGAGHTALGAVAYRDSLAAMLRGGVGSAGEGAWSPAETARRQRAFWFEVSGVALVLLGDAVGAQERSVQRPPRRLGWAVGALAVLGGAAMPVSGFWALLVPAAVLVRRGRRP